MNSETTFCPLCVGTEGLRRTLQRRLAPSSEREDPLERLEDFGLVEAHLCEDARGTFVAVESGRTDPARLLRTLISTDLLY